MVDRLATFGRWAFFAGGVYTFVLVGVGRAVDWPDWLGTVVSVAVGLAAFRLIDRLATRAAVNPLNVGRCGEACPVILDHSPRQVCALLAGHTGWHRADDGCEWGLIDNAPTARERR